MSDNNILIVATFVAKPGTAETLHKVLSACVLPSRKEAGNILYNLYRSTEDDHQFLFHEIWKNQAAIDQHNEQTHFKTLLAESAALLTQAPDVRVSDITA